MNLVVGVCFRVVSVKGMHRLYRVRHTHPASTLPLLVLIGRIRRRVTVEDAAIPTPCLSLCPPAVETPPGTALDADTDVNLVPVYVVAAALGTDHARNTHSAMSAPTPNPNHHA